MYKIKVYSSLRFVSSIRYGQDEADIQLKVTGLHPNLLTVLRKLNTNGVKSFKFFGI
jgi:hypothetical protein